VTLQDLLFGRPLGHFLEANSLRRVSRLIRTRNPAAILLGSKCGTFFSDGLEAEVKLVESKVWVRVADDRQTYRIESSAEIASCARTILCV
jgi:hypothetical protein